MSVNMAIADSCGDWNVVNPNFDAGHPFWGSSNVGSYDYLDAGGCLHHVNCYTKYIFWISVKSFSTDETVGC